MKRPIYYLAIFIVFNSCTSTSNLNYQSYITKISYEECNRTYNKMFVFFEGEDFDFNYKKVGIITTEGKVGIPGNQTFERFKNAAWQNCANGIIFITTEEGERIDASGNYYKVLIYEGLAIQIEMDEAFEKQYGDESDITFIENVQKWDDEAAQSKEKAKRAGDSFLTFLVVIGLLTIAAL